MTEPGETQGAAAIARAVREGERTARSFVEEALARIAARDPELAAFERVDAEAALARADAIDGGGAGAGGALAGVPVALKSNMCVRGSVSNCGSRMLAGYRAPYTATFVERLLAAGAIPVGATHMDEFSMGSSGENSAFATTRNPWDPTRVPGGSSSGAAVAVAAGLVPLALGSDTGGSARQPASLCGVVGFRPTYGRVSRYGLIAFASSLDQVAPLARSIEDVELALAAISGADARDATTIDEGPFEPDGRATLAGLSIGVAPELSPASVDARVRACFDAALGTLAAAGARIVEVPLPSAAYGNPAYYVIAMAEASSNLARYDGVRYGARAGEGAGIAQMMSATRRAGFGREVVRRIVLGTHVLSSGYHEAWYGRAQRARAEIAADFDRAFESVDLIACPTSPVPAFPLGERVRDPVAMYSADVLTVPPSLAGLPAVSVPAGTCAAGGRALPVGLQIVGPRGADARVLAAARGFQRASGHGDGWPTAPAGFSGAGAA